MNRWTGHFPAAWSLLRSVPTSLLFWVQVQGSTNIAAGVRVVQGQTELSLKSSSSTLDCMASDMWLKGSLLVFSSIKEGQSWTSSSQLIFRGTRGRGHPSSCLSLCVTARDCGSELALELAWFESCLCGCCNLTMGQALHSLAPPPTSSRGQGGCKSPPDHPY